LSICCLGAVDFFFGHAFGADFLGCGDEDVAHFLEGIVARSLPHPG
jgi:hypothetical protein